MESDLNSDSSSATFWSFKLRLVDGPHGASVSTCINEEQFQQRFSGF